MSATGDHEDRVRRLEARLAREKAARLEAEAIAERVTSDRWEQRTVLEGKLAERTQELEAAREVASRATTERERILSEVSHRLRTSLTVLVLAIDDLGAHEPLGESRLVELKAAIDDMRNALDEDAFSSSGDPRPTREPPPLSRLLEEHEEHWQRAAALTGKLLMVDLAGGWADVPVRDADDLNQRVLAAIDGLSESDASMVELRLAPDGSGGFAVEVAAG